MVFALVTYEFVSELMNEKNKESEHAAPAGTSLGTDQSVEVGSMELQEEHEEEITAKEQQ